MSAFKITSLKSAQVGAHWGWLRRFSLTEKLQIICKVFKGKIIVANLMVETI